MDKFDFKNNNFDLLRLIAAMQVVIMHSFAHLNLGHIPYIHYLLSIFPGVLIFFVISGFLISASYEKSNNVISYCKNRILRIYPALWICFIVSFTSAYIYYHPVASWKEYLPWFCAQLSICQFYNPDFMRGYGVGVLNGSLWTIPVELQFYFVLPFVYFLFQKINWNRLIIYLTLFGFFLINQLYLKHETVEQGIIYKLFGVSIFPYFSMFFIGIILQKNIWFVKKYLLGRAFYLFIIYIIVCYTLSFFGIHVNGKNINPLSGIILALLIISFAYSDIGIINKILMGNDISYGVYIYHMIVINVLVQLGYTGSYASFFIVFTITVFLATLSWIFIEKPSMKLKTYSVVRHS